VEHERQLMSLSPVAVDQRGMTDTLWQRAAGALDLALAADLNDAVVCDTQKSRSVSSVAAPWDAGGPAWSLNEKWRAGDASHWRRRHVPKRSIIA